MASLPRLESPPAGSARQWLRARPAARTPDAARSREAPAAPWGNSPERAAMGTAPYGSAQDVYQLPVSRKPTAKG